MTRPRTAARRPRFRGGVAGAGVSRREFLQAGSATLAGLTLARAAETIPAPAIVGGDARPDLLLIIVDQMNLDAMSALGNPHLRTPHLDRLAARGTLFLESHSTNPVCSPARSSLLTGRMPVETGVTQNDLPVRAGMPNLGEWLRDRAGYETVYCGKWHLPGSIFMPGFGGFRPLAGGGGQGAVDDGWVTRGCEAYLRSRARRRNNSPPFALVASYLQPHDICYWMIHPETLVSPTLPFPRLAAEWPALPPNHRSRPPGPERAMAAYGRFASEDAWRYYLYCYYRMVEMLDHDVGRLLEALEGTGLAGNTLVLLTSDHGEGAGRHGNVQKWHPYDESLKVPLICALPGRVGEGVRNAEHLVSGLDVVSTFCDYAGVVAPPKVRGLSLRPLLEGRPAEWRQSLVCEWQRQGRVVRTPQHKLVTYGDEAAVQLFDLRADPWETTNLADEASHTEVVRHHRRLLEEWEARLDVCPGAPGTGGRK
jgi:arylsulfatase A-like enzyme